MVKKVTKTLNLSRLLNKVDSKDRRVVLEEISEYLVTEILDHVGSATTPVKGGKYLAQLTDSYKKIKKEISGSTVANMELHGDMLDSLRTEINVDAGTVEVGYFEDAGSENLGKADMHNKFTPESKKGKRKKYYRQHIPRANEVFSEKIMEGIENIIGDYED